MKSIYRRVAHHAHPRRQARPFGDIAAAKQKGYDDAVKAWKDGGKLGPVPIMQTLSTMARVGRSEYKLAEVANQLGVLGRASGHRAPPAVVSRERTRGAVQTVKNLMPGPERILPRDGSASETNKRLREIQSLGHVSIENLDDVTTLMPGVPLGYACSATL